VTAAKVWMDSSITSGEGGVLLVAGSWVKSVATVLPLQDQSTIRRELAFGGVQGESTVGQVCLNHEPNSPVHGRHFGLGGGGDFPSTIAVRTMSQDAQEACTWEQKRDGGEQGAARKQSDISLTNQTSSTPTPAS
jgi:hypothetical protein